MNCSHRLTPVVFVLAVWFVLPAVSADDDVEGVRIGYFGPADAEHPSAGDMWQAASLAIDEANAEGGCRGLPFRLLPAWSENPWGTGVKDLARLVYDEKVWAIVGGPDGSSTHLAEQIVAKAQLTLVSPVSTDRTANLANVSWMFSVAPGDHLAAESAAECAVEEGGRGGIVLLSSDDHDARVFSVALKKSLTKRGIGLGRELAFRRGAEHFDALARQVAENRPPLVFVAADPADSARLVIALRKAGYAGRLIGSPTVGHRQFALLSAATGQGILFPLLYDAADSSDTNRRFLAAFERRSGHLPDYTAACTYDAVRLLVAAIRKAGLDRAAIRDAVSELSPWVGVSGTVTWDSHGGNTRCVPMATIMDGVASPRRPRLGLHESTAR